jgi:putative GTP pyrophosphokinase
MSLTLEESYRKRHDSVLLPLAQSLEKLLKDYFADVPRIDRVTTRAKSLQRFLQKAEKIENEQNKYSDPLNQIQDQIGARIVTYYFDDVDRISEVVETYFRPIELKTIVPDSESEFGYFGKHYILIIPEDLITEDIEKSEAPCFFELQIKTLFQHAWGEANHDLGYKADRQLSSDEKRKIAFTSAQAWGADMIFNELSRKAEEEKLHSSDVGVKETNTKAGSV